MGAMNIQSSWGEIAVDLDDLQGQIYLGAVIAPASVNDFHLRKLLNETDPNTIEGNYLLSKLALARKLVSPVDIGIIVGRISPMSFMGLITTEELKRVGVIAQAHIEKISSRFDVDDFLELGTSKITQDEQALLVAPLTRLGILTRERANEVRNKIDSSIPSQARVIDSLKTYGLVQAPLGIDRH